jgi:hypothetical protein
MEVRMPTRAIIPNRRGVPDDDTPVVDTRTRRIKLAAAETRPKTVAMSDRIGSPRV